MRKFLLFVLMLCPLAGYSQISWNVKAGMNISNFISEFDVTSGVGFRAGGGMEYAFNEYFSLQPSLLFSRRTIKSDSYIVDPISSTWAIRVILNAHYLELPVLFAGRIKLADRMNLVVSAGPYFGYGIGGKIETDATRTKEETFNRYLQRFDFGAATGLTFEYTRLFLSIEYQLSMIDISRDIYNEEKTMRNTNIAVSLGYRF